jgi:hypothetical protein
MLHVRGRVTRGRLVVDETGDEIWPVELDAELAARAADVEAGRFHTLEEVLTLLRTGG